MSTPTTDDLAEIHHTVDRVARTNNERRWLLVLVGALIGTGLNPIKAANQVAGELMLVRYRRDNPTAVGV